MVVNGTDENDWEGVIALAQEHTCVMPAIGLHPWCVNNASPNWKQTMQTLLDKRHLNMSIGEIGLDKWIQGYDLEKQIDAFTWQLKQANAYNLPVSIHCLKAWGMLLNVLNKNARPQQGFLLHSYGGPAEMVDAFVELGAYFSFSGYLAHERKAKQQALFKTIPIERVLVETDAPDMLPPETLIEFPLNDDKAKKAINHPANIKAIYHYLSHLRKIEMDALCPQIEKNFNRLFLHRSLG